MVTSYNTAISRKKPSLPLRMIISSLNPSSRVLDYGGGKGVDSDHLSSMGFESDCYDPHWNPIDLSDKYEYYDYVLCTYVLNVLPKKEEDIIISSAVSHLKPGGKLFITVRRDIKDDAYTSRGYQRVVSLNEDIFLRKNGSFCIYQITRS
jgi:2-polyprenyl-3-methyl-5-hydroxy-6-metoxy-1,4-benzoquinol methylase|tara:strand:- start:275 stop:724 length:450 start_codon:yes stop_codon:yes gene_type:complete